MDIGDQVREARKRCGLSQAQVAERLGVTQPTINRIETGATPLTLERAWRLERVIGPFLPTSAPTREVTRSAVVGHMRADGVVAAIAVSPGDIIEVVEATDVNRMQPRDLLQVLACDPREGDLALFLVDEEYRVARILPVPDAGIRVAAPLAADGAAFVVTPGVPVVGVIVELRRLYREVGDRAAA